MNNRKIIGILSLFFASICIRFPLEPAFVNPKLQSSTFPETLISLVVLTISVLLFAFGIVQMIVSFLAEDLPALRQISKKNPDVSTNS